jgi:MYXO-CTERM domain-containing protein
VALAWGVPTAQAQFTAGNFTYQFADPVTGLPITQLTIPAIGGTGKVAVYLLQNSGTAQFPVLGLDGLGVRLNYPALASGGVARVANNQNLNVTARPAPAFNPNAVNSDYTLIQRYGSATGSDTTSSAAISEGLVNADDPVPIPGNANEDPLHNNLRMLIGTFTFTGLANGVETVTAVSGPSAGTNSLTGPSPPQTGLRNDGTTGLLPGNGATSISLDPLLSSPAPTLAITVGVPEPGTLALGSMAVVGLAAWRRRRNATAVAA